MTTSKQDESHRRSATRAPIDKPIKLQFDDSMDVIEGHCRNLSIGGMFILYEHSRPTGSLVRFELEIAEDSAIRGLGEVVWMSSRSSFGGPEAGFGLKFRFLEQRDRQLIFKLVSQHIKARLSKRTEPGGEALPPVTGVEKVATSPELSPAIAIPPEPPAPPASLAEVQVEPPAAIETPPEADPLPPPASSAESAAPLPPSGEPRGDDWAQLTPPPGSFAVSEDIASGDIAVGDTMAGNSVAGNTVSGATEKASPGPASDLPPVFDPIDLDPSVGETPIYELGLDSKTETPRPSFFNETPAATEPPAPEGFGTSGPSAAQPASEDLPWVSSGMGGGGGPSESHQPGESASEEEFLDSTGAAAARREFSILPVLAVLFLAIAFGFYLFKDEIFEKLSGSPTPVATAETPPDDAALPEAALPGTASADGTSADGTSADGTSADDTPGETGSADGISTEIAPGTEGPETPSPSEAAASIPSAGTAPMAKTTEPAAPTATPVVAPPPSRQPTPSTQAPPPSDPSPMAAAPAEAQPSPTAAGFTLLEDISWQEVPGGFQVVLTANGAIPTGRYKYLRINDKLPREVVKLFGVSRQYSQRVIQVGGPAVRQIRTGFHRKNGQNEIHVVIDLLGSEWKMTEVRNLGNRLELLITRP